MKKVLLVICMVYSGCTYVEPGYVGIKVNMYGSQKGVEDFPLQTGRVWYNPWTTDIHKYPTFMQNKAWTDDLNEGSPVKEGITFNSSEGAQITADVALDYTLDAEQVPSLFVEFRQDVNIITNTYLRNQVRNTFNRVGGSYKAVDIFGERKQFFLDEVKQELDEKLKGRAFQIDSIAFIGSPRADTRVMQSINMVIEATQRAIEAENKVRQIEAEAQQKIAEAEGQAQSVLKVAQAQAEANRVLAESLTPELVRYQMVEKWDGIAPKVMGQTDLMLMMEEK